MKLDKSVIDKVLIEIGWGQDDESRLVVKQYLENVDLVIKPGDSSQSTLVENNPQQK